MCSIGNLFILQKSVQSGLSRTLRWSSRASDCRRWIFETRAIASRFIIRESHCNCSHVLSQQLSQQDEAPTGNGVGSEVIKSEERKTKKNQAGLFTKMIDRQLFFADSLRL